MVVDLVADCLGGQEFPVQVLGRTHRVYPAPDGARERFAHLLTWPALNELLSTHRLEPPRLRLVRDGNAVPVDEYCELRTYRRMPPWQAPQPNLLAQQLREGAMLVLDAIEEMHPPIRHLAGSLERWLRTGVQVNAYASCTSREGFGVHWDDHDVIVVQIQGAKRWRIYGSTRRVPLYRDVAFDDTPPEQPIDGFTLRAGDVLHVPRGWWHAAAASVGEPSLHLTCGLATHTGVDLLTWLVDELRVHEVVRSDVPRFAADTDQAAWRAELAKLLTEQLDAPDLIDAYTASRDAGYGSHAVFSLPYAALGEIPDDSGVPVRLTCSRAVVRDGDDATVLLEAAGQRWRLASAARPVLDLLIAGHAVALGELSEVAGLDLARVRTLLTRLMDAGMIAVGESE